MITFARWKCIVLISISVSHSSGLLKTESNISIVAAGDSNYEENSADMLTDIVGDFNIQDMIQQEIHTRYDPYILQGNKSANLIFEDMNKTVEEYAVHQERKSRKFIGCSYEIHERKDECMDRCSGPICRIKEANKFMFACMITGTKQTCSTPATVGIPCLPCGTPNTARRRRRFTIPIRIVGGVDVDPPRKYPWQASLLRNGLHECGGSIINKRWILSAGHCLIDTDVTCKPISEISTLQIRIGEHDLNTITDDDEFNTKDYDIKRYVIHPDADCPWGRPGGRNYDVALIELTEDIPFNDVIRPVCLPDDDSKTYAGNKGTVSGWGTSDGGWYPPMFLYYENILKEVDIPIDHQHYCRGWGRLPDVQLCAGNQFVRGTCLGDSGGPLVVNDGYNKFIQVGVVSYGPIPCDDDRMSAVYVRVSKVLDWIKETTVSGKC